MKRIIPLILSILFCLGLASCVSYQVPKDYLPDNKVVYLTQNTAFEPIAYRPEAADPYVFAADQSAINAQNPAFLRNTDWNNLLKADFKADSRLFREVEANFSYIMSLPIIKELRTILDAAVIEPTPPLSAEKGAKLKDYTNGALYEYPAVADAQITILDTGYYEISFPDKSIFRYQADGTYVRLSASGQIVFAVYPKLKHIIISQAGLVLKRGPDFRQVSGPQGSLFYTETPEPQYQFTPTNDAQAPVYTLFVDPQKKVHSVALGLKNGLRFNYFPKAEGLKDEGVLITNGDQALSINSRYQKTHQRFDQVAHKTSDLLSVFLPEGIRLTNFVSTEPAYGQVNPGWPEGYKTKALGPFDLLYLPKDEALIARLKADRLTAIADAGRKLTGLSPAQRRTLLIPPDLATYRKLLVSTPGEVINWHPSGFATKDIIVMWPISVPRYSNANGQDYFFDKEFYEILSHEYVHILVGENTGLLNQVPVWLNEGLAVWVETSYAPEVKYYWDLTFRVSQGLDRLLDWDLVTSSGTGTMEIAKARIHYAQSYALVAALMQKFGSEKVVAYLKSFRSKAMATEIPDLKTTYKSKFKSIFGVEFSQALKLLDPVAPDPAKKS